MGIDVIRATDPATSVVVEACAGSGKTWLLVTRIFRLLLSGAPPDSILAITFTRKAAEEMLQRLEELLEQCVLLPDEELRDLLRQRGCAAHADDPGRVRALALGVFRGRRGVEVNTFHGWFTSLCQLAPTMIGFSRQAEPSELGDFWLNSAWDAWMADLASRAGDDADVACFTALVGSTGSFKARALIIALARQRAAWRLLRRERGDDGLQAKLSTDFRVEELQGREAAFFESADLLQHRDLLVRLQSSDSDAKRKVVLPLPQAWTDRDLDAITRVLRKSDGDRRNFTFTKGFLEKLPADELERFERAVESLQSGHEAVLAARDDLRWHAWTSAGLQLLPAFLQHHEAVKAQAGVIDFDDLEIVASDIMASEEASAWVQMRLDRRTRHVLLDEFQDTNPLQWLILRNWLESQVPGEGQTVFMVGDPKQSIYRFRRAEARLFTHVSDWMQARLGAIVLRNDQSRRCAQGLLAAVNAAFTGPKAQRSGSTPIAPHTGVHDSAGSGLYVLPLLPKAGKLTVVNRENWLATPASAVADGGDVSPTEAQRVAATLQAWKRNGSIARWDSVMVLVRRHDDARPLGEALQAAGVPHSINDRGGRFASLLWSDSLALLRVLLSSLNERSVLQLLRSPFFNLSPETVGRWLQAMERSTESVPGKLLIAAERVGGEVAAAMAAVERWRAWAVELPLYEVLDRIFRETDIEAAALATAPERERQLAQRHWAWLIDWALDIDKGRHPHPLRALEEAARLGEWSSASSAQTEHDEAVRIYTVHSAKGLEADIVWLLNSNRDAGGERQGDMKTLLHWPVGDSAPSHLSVFAGRKDRGGAREALFADELRAQNDETDHLLYVAMTRARHRLYVSGTVSGKEEVEAGSWYARLSVLDEAVKVDWDAVAPSPECNADAAPDVRLPTDTLPSPAASVVTWETLPALPRWPTPVGSVLTVDDHPGTRRGQAWHACLEWVDARFFSAFEDWWQQISRRPDCAALLARIDDAACHEIHDRLKAMSANRDVRPLLDDSVVDEAWNEFEWMDSDGRLHRADRILRQAQDWLVVDYKWAWTPEDIAGYTDQLRRYAAAIRQTFDACGQVKGILVSSQGECLHLNLGE